MYRKVVLRPIPPNISFLFHSGVKNGAQILFLFVLYKQKNFKGRIQYAALKVNSLQIFCKCCLCSKLLFYDTKVATHKKLHHQIFRKK